MTAADDGIPVGSRWREVCSGRVVVALGPGPDSPWLRVESTGEVFYCCAEDFFVWGRFVRL